MRGRRSSHGRAGRGGSAPLFAALAVALLTEAGVPLLTEAGGFLLTES